MTILDTETMGVVAVLQLMVDALNMAFMAKDEATDHMLEADEIDGLFSDLRDWAAETQERLRREIDKIAKDHNLELRFNRLDGTFVLLSGE